MQVSHEEIHAFLGLLIQRNGTYHFDQYDIVYDVYTSLKNKLCISENTSLVLSVEEIDAMCQLFKGDKKLRPVVEKLTKYKKAVNLKTKRIQRRQRMKRRPLTNQIKRV